MDGQRTSRLRPLVCSCIPVTFPRPVLPASPPGPAPADTAWMPHPRRWNDMNAASTPYAPVREVPEWREFAPASRISLPPRSSARTSPAVPGLLPLQT